MELEEVGKLIAFVVLGVLAAERGWAVFRPQPLAKAVEETNGKLSELQEELDKLYRKAVDGKLEEILGIVKDNHEDINTLRADNKAEHLKIEERLKK